MNTPMYIQKLAKQALQLLLRNMSPSEKQSTCVNNLYYFFMWDCELTRVNVDLNSHASKDPSGGTTFLGLIVQSVEIFVCTMTRVYCYYIINIVSYNDAM